VHKILRAPDGNGPKSRLRVVEVVCDGDPTIGATIAEAAEATASAAHQAHRAIPSPPSPLSPSFISPTNLSEADHTALSVWAPGQSSGKLNAALSLWRRGRHSLVHDHYDQTQDHVSTSHALSQLFVGRTFDFSKFSTYGKEKRIVTSGNEFQQLKKSIDLKQGHFKGSL
jgi:hypothetical protein